MRDITTLEIPLAIGVCILYVFVGLAIHYYKEQHGHSPWIHESSISCLFGLLVGGLIKYFTSISISFDGTLFFYLVLPPIIFSAGFSLKRKRFFQYIHLITFFGVVGTIVNFLIIACGAKLYAHLVVNTTINLSWNEALLFASVLAGSDEVAAMSLIRIKDYPRMGALIFGEGVINDALSIVLFKTFLPLYNADIASRNMILTNLSETMVNYVSSSSLVICFSIAFQIFCSCVIGITCGLLNARIMKALTFTKKYPISQTALVLLFGYLAYTVAEALGVSGILTLFVAAIVLAHYSWYSLSNAAQITTRISFAAMSDIAEGFAFSYVGLSLWGFHPSDFEYQYAFYMLFVVVVARFASLLGLFFVGRLVSRSFDIPFSEQMGFALGGVVRGCLCWAQILQVKGYAVLVTSTLIIVMTTLLAGGVLMPIIIPRLGVAPLLKGNRTSHTRLRSAVPSIDNLHGGEGGQDDSGPNHNQRENENLLNNTAFYSCENGLSRETTDGDIEMRQSQYVAPRDRNLVNVSIFERTWRPDIRVDTTRMTDHAIGVDLDEGEEYRPPAAAAVVPAVSLGSLIYVYWVRLDERVLKPLFGGSATDATRGQLLQETANVTLMSVVTPRAVGGGGGGALASRTSSSTTPHYSVLSSETGTTRGTAAVYDYRSTAPISPPLFRGIDFTHEGYGAAAGVSAGAATPQSTMAVPPPPPLSVGEDFDDVQEISREMLELANKVGEDTDNDLILDDNGSIIDLSSPPDSRGGFHPDRTPGGGGSHNHPRNNPDNSLLSASGASNLSYSLTPSPDRRYTSSSPHRGGGGGGGGVSERTALLPEGGGAAARVPPQHHSEDQRRALAQHFPTSILSPIGRSNSKY